LIRAFLHDLAQGLDEFWLRGEKPPQWFVDGCSQFHLYRRAIGQLGVLFQFNRASAYHSAQAHTHFTKKNIP